MIRNNPGMPGPAGAYACTKHVMRATARVQRRRPGAKLKYAWQLTSGLCFYRPSTAGHSQARCKCGQWLRSLQVDPVMHGMNGTHKRQSPAHDFIVKPCMCSYISCPGWRDGWHYVILGYLG